MKTKKLNIFRRITFLLFSLITILAILFMLVAYFSATHFYQASTQLLNKDVAAHIAKFTSPFGNKGLDKDKADSVFYQAMVLSPSVEVYFLDTTGKVIYFHAPDGEIKKWQLPLEQIKKYISAEGKEYIRGPDPKDTATPKIFSAAEVKSKTKRLGYIYVILGSKEYRNVTQLLFNSHIGGLALKAFVFIIIVTILLSLYYVMRINRHFKNLFPVLEKFEAGDYTARFATKEMGDLSPIPEAFNKMADLLTYTINRLKNAEQERKDFIANVSHDLRTPLAIARGYAETMMIKKDDAGLTTAEREEYLKLVVNNIGTVENMVQQLFEFSKMEISKLTPQQQPFLFAELALDIISSFRLAAEEKGIAISCEHCNNEAWVNADIQLMERVIQNLLGNAIKYTAGEGTIKIEITKIADDLIFRITNPGNPLTPELLQWLNDPDLENNTTLKHSNKGIGLTLVKKILQLHQFPFEVQQVAGFTNIFSFRMPIYNK